ncbi:MAG: DUF2148 domain-containing protein [Candidatus Nezhaarchaeales archaeon]|nr:MAG: ferredoxin [Candidatus Nezhaarchaeota archaeon WYZ-LMO8]TDA36002.1 MAG: ferredoxin [Candidatus Nezhaarchaeota archaeon WYZ-LMO7]
MVVESREKIVEESLINVARLMALSAITAPKARGVDNVVVGIIQDRTDIERLAEVMEKMAEELGEYFRRDADNIRRSNVVVLIGCKVKDIGVKAPRSHQYDINLVLNLINLGIAIGSAVKTASLHNVDNRVMYTAGLAAQTLKLIDADVVLAIPLSATSKNIYFDRPPITR